MSKRLRNVPILWDLVKYTPTFTALGTVTNIDFWYGRVGDYVRILGKATTGTVAASEARISLPAGLVSDPKKVTTIRGCGSFLYGSVGTVTAFCLIESNVGYMTFGYRDASNGDLTKQNGNTLIGSTVDFSLWAEIPIAGWKSNR